jgi:RNA polymerase sigma-70 factor (ECF subfamily)
VWNDSRNEEDSSLVVQFRNGDPLAFEKLVRKYQQTVLNLAYHYIGSRNDIEDVAQRVFLKIYFSISKFDVRRPFTPWLYRIAINQCYDELRKTRRRKVRTFSELTRDETRDLENLISRSGISEVGEERRQEMHALLYKLLDRLTKKQRLAIVLRDFESVSYSEMAGILKCTEQAARLKVFRARARLKKLLEETLHAAGV